MATGHSTCRLSTDQWPMVLFGVICLLLTPALGTFLNFKPGFEYHYKLNSTIHLKDVGYFLAKAKVGFENIHESSDRLELRLTVDAFTFAPIDNPEVTGHDLDFSEWFSFEITRRGEILRVFHPADDDEEVLGIKKGISAMLSGLFIEQEQTSYFDRPTWSYSSQEHGFEGHHNASYKAKKTSTGHAFTKTRHDYSKKLQNSESKYKKVVHIHSDIDTVHSVMVEEDFTTHYRPQPGYDPFSGIRPVKAVNEFSDLEYPEMKASARDELHFMTRKKTPTRMGKPLDMKETEITHLFKRKKRQLQKEDLPDMIANIKGNVTCMRAPSDIGNIESNSCFLTLTSMLEQLPDHSIEELADYYLVQMKPVLQRNVQDRNSFLDVLASTNHPAAQTLLVKKVIKRPFVDQDLIQRLMTHFATMERQADQVLIDTLEDLCFGAGRDYLSKATYHSVLLAMGGIIKRLAKHGADDKARRLLQQIHQELGLHDPWHYIMKREVMSEQLLLEHDLEKVILLESLGNAAMDESYEYILSHINTTNSPWIKRAAIYALRHYHSEQAAITLMLAAGNDQDANVRYEANLQFLAHPLANNITRAKIRDAETALAVRDKRFLSGEAKFLLEAPGVNWQKVVGSTSIGASFGVLMENLLDLKISLLSGHLKIRVHDEAYARVHLGFIGITYDFLHARICFKGGTSYNLNIFQEMDPELGPDLFKQFKAIVGNVVKGVKDGIELFRSVITGEVRLQDIIADFVNVIKTLPNRIVRMAVAITSAVKKLARVNMEELPPFIQPVKRLVLEVSTFYQKVKNDVMSFYNNIVEVVEIILPQAAEQIVSALSDIIDGFMGIFKDPKTSLLRVGKGVFSIYNQIVQLNETKNTILEHAFLEKGEKSYFMNLKGDVATLFDLANKTVRELRALGRTWVADVVSSTNDVVAIKTRGRKTYAQIKRALVEELETMVEEIVAPIDELRNLGNGFFDKFMKLFDLVKNVKEAFALLKKGYEYGRTLVDRIFGPKCHKDFPKTKREAGGGCSGDGFYPSRLGKGTEYSLDGIDVLVEEGTEVVAPFGGYVVRSGNTNEIKITSEDLPRNSIVVLTNIDPTEIADEGETRVGAGDVIGVATRSPCSSRNHIHFAVVKGNGVIDPSNYLAPRFPEVPKWKQDCDDFKLVYKNEVVKAGYIIGLMGQKESDTSENVSTDGETPPAPLEPSRRKKRAPGKMFRQLAKRRKKRASEFLDQIGASINKLIDNIKNFIKNFSIRRLKLGDIIEFLDSLELHESKQRMADLMITIKDALSTKPCENPKQMTEEELQTELRNRGKDSSGNKEEMIARLKEMDMSCPLLSLNIPDLPGGVYCFFAEDCMEIQCCLSVEIMRIFQLTLRAFVRYDPVANVIQLGFHEWTYELNLNDLISAVGRRKREAVHFPNFEIDKTILTDIRLKLIGDEAILVKFSIQKTQSEVVVSLGGGICETQIIEECFTYFDLLKDAVFPLPTVYTNGTVVWPKVNWSEYFNKEAIQRRLKEAARQAGKAVVSEAIDVFLARIGLTEELLNNTPPCYRPSRLSGADLQKMLLERNISLTGTDQEKIYRLEESDRSCTQLGKNIALPVLPNKLRNVLYYQLSSDCMRLDVCVDLRISAINYTKSFAAYISLDPCNFVFTIAFERISKPFILIGYEWGTEKSLKLAPNVGILFSIDKNDESKVFMIDVGLQIDEIDERLIENFEIPIPFCNSNFSLDGFGDISGLAMALGGELNEAAFKLIISRFGLDKIFIEDSCSNENSDTECALLIDVNNSIPNSMKNILSCHLPDSCFGLRCCAAFTITIPLSSKTYDLEIPLWFTLDPCSFSFQAGVGTYYHKEQLLNYQWGKPGYILIGGKDPPVNISYTVSKYEDGFIVDAEVNICIKIDRQKTCFPPNGLKLLDNQEIPACNLDALKNLSDFSLREYLAERGESIANDLSSSGGQLILEILGVSKYMKSPSCDRKRRPYDPALNGWNNVCPLSFSKQPELPSFAVCHIPEHCTGIDCCIGIEKLGVAFNVFLDIDLCSYIVSGGIEKVLFNFSLVQYEWGRVETVTIMDVLKIKYSIRRPKDEKIFILDASVAACFERDGSCLFEFPIFKSTEVPQFGCDLAATINFKEFSLEAWKQNNGLGNIGPNDELWGKLIGFVAEAIGLDKYFLKPQCDVESSVYQPSVNGIKNACPKFDVSTLPMLPSGTSCFLDETCFSIECCTSVSWLQRTLHIYFDIDMCNFTISGGIEKFGFNFSILNYEFGTERTETILELIRLRYAIQKAKTDFIVDLKVSVCMEAHGDCEFTIPLFERTAVPIPLCNLDMDFRIKDFSLNKWVQQKGYELSESLPSAVVDALLKELGLNRFLKSPQCDFNGEPFDSAVDGWKNDCPVIEAMPPLPDFIKCQIPHYCTGIDCCVYVDLIRRSLTMRVLLDACRYKLVIGIERLELNVSLLEYEWGTTKQIFLGGVIRTEFNIVDLNAVNMFVVNVNMSICMEQTTCVFTSKVLANAYMSKPLCNWDEGFQIPDFSIDRWMQLNGISSSGDLTHVFLDKLLVELGISDYLQERQCTAASSMFQPNHGGWKKDCPMNVSLPTLPDGLTCFIPDYCTGIDCCLEVDVFQRSIHAYAYIDTCNYNLMIGIEKFSFNESLTNFQWGTEKTLNLNGVLRLKYALVELKAEKELIVNIGIAVCLDATSECMVDIPVFTEMVLPKPLCNWKSGYGNRNFSLSNYFETLGEKITDQVEQHVIDRLLETLNIAGFMRDEVCSPGKDTSTLQDNWEIECPLISKLPKLPDPIVCSIPSYCTGLQCCLDVPVLRREIGFYVLLDGCNYTLTTGIENFNVTYSLLDYEWGTKDQLYLKDVFRIDFSVEDLHSAKSFIVSVNLSACLEPDECLFSSEVLKDVVFPKPLCNFEDSFKLPVFSIDEWKDIHGHSLTNLLAARLLDELGIAPYLQDNVCSTEEGLYASSESGWTNACPKDITLPELPASTACHISDYCTGISCCIEIPELGRSFEFRSLLDGCKFKLTLGIEGLEYDIPLINYEWGAVYRFTLAGVLHVGVNITDFTDEQAFIVTLWLEVCFSSSRPCAFRLPILSNERLPKPLCNWDDGFLIPDFSLQTWLSSNGLTIPDRFSDVLLAKLIDTLGINQFLESPSCDRTEQPYSQTSGWTKECPLDLPLDTLPDSISCHIPDFCTGVDCCIDVPIFSRSMHLYLLMDTCKMRMIIGIENLKLNISLATYQWGQMDTLSMGGVLQIEYKIVEDAERNVLTIDVTLSICFEAMADCDIVIPILTSVNITKPLCRWDAGFIKEGFSLEQWLTDHDVNIQDHLLPSTVDLLFEDLGISTYLNKVQCSRNEVPFVPSIAGWNTDCQKVKPNSTLPAAIACHIPRNCKEIECCTSVEMIQRSFHIYLEIDPCMLYITIGIERLKVQVPFSKYEWGAVKELYLLGVVRLEFSIDHRVARNTFIVNLNASVCFETTGTCVFSAIILKNSIFPKPPCEMGTSFLLPDFSFQNWIEINNFDLTNGIPTDGISQLLEMFGVKDYLLFSQCDQRNSTYTTNGWAKGSCPAVLSPLPPALACNLSDACNKLDCCLFVDALQRSINFRVEVDFCEWKLEVGIENYTSDILLVNYKFGRDNTFQLMGMFQISFRVLDLKAEKEFVLRLSVKFCPSAIGGCLLEFPVLDNVRLPKPVCNWNFTDFKIPDFSFTDYVAEKNISLESSALMPYALVDEVLDQLGLASYLLSSQCDPVQADIQRPLTECGEFHFRLPTNSTCNISKTCSGVSCCVQANPIPRAFSFNVDIDMCCMKMRIEMENARTEISLTDYSFSTQRTFTLFGVLRTSLKLEDLVGERSLIVSLNISVCMESSGECLAHISVFDDAKMRKPLCEWSPEMSIKDFSLVEWRKSFGADLVGSLNNLEISALLEDLDLAHFLQEKACSLSQEPYSSSINGWRSDCGAFVAHPLETEFMTCYVDASCTTLRCCADIKLIQRTLEFSLSFDPCTQNIKAAIETHQVTTSFSEFKWGSYKEIGLLDVLKLAFRIDYLASNQIFLLDLDVDVCFGMNHCSISETVLNRTVFQASLCNETLFTDFSLADWKAQHGLPTGVSLDGVNTDRLLEHLGIGQYLPDSCTYEDIVSENDWTNECGPLDLPSLPEGLRCNINSACTRLACCLNIQEISLTVPLHLNVDVCNSTVGVGIGAFNKRLPFVAYDLETSHELTLFGFITLRYSLFDLAGEGHLLISSNVGYKINSNSSLESSFVIVRNLRLPKHACDWTNTGIKEDFNLTAWLQDRSYKLSSLPEQALRLLFQDYGVEQYLSSPMCNRNDWKYGIDSRSRENTDKECPLQLALNSVQGLASCAVLKSCSFVDCCVSSSTIPASIHFTLDLDVCSFRVIFTIEQLSHRLDLMTYRWGETKEFSVNGIWNLSMKLQQHGAEDSCFHKETSLETMDIQA